MKKFSLLLICAFLAVAVQAQSVSVPDNIKPYIEAGINGMKNSFKSFNVDSLLFYTHPGVKNIATEDQLKEAIGAVFTTMKPEDIKGFEISGPVQLVQEGNEWQGIFMQKLHLILNSEEYKSEVPLLAESFNNGKNWYFFDYKKNEELARMIMPNLSSKLTLKTE